MHRGGQAIAALAVGGCISVTAAVRARPATLLSPVRGLSRTERTTDKAPENATEKLVPGPVAGAVAQRSAGQAAVSTPAVPPSGRW